MGRALVTPECTVWRVLWLKPVVRRCATVLLQGLRGGSLVGVHHEGVAVSCNTTQRGSEKHTQEAGRLREARAARRVGRLRGGARSVEEECERAGPKRGGMPSGTSLSACPCARWQNTLPIFVTSVSRNFERPRHLVTMRGHECPLCAVLSARPHMPTPHMPTRTGGSSSLGRKRRDTVSVTDRQTDNLVERHTASS